MFKALIDSLIECGKDEKSFFIVIDDYDFYEVLNNHYPDRTFHGGIMESNAVLIAAGMSNNGCRAYIIGANTFMAYRGYDFIRCQLCMPNLDAIIIGIGAGLAISAHGNTHHATEDLGVLRTLPNLNVITPATSTEIKYIFNYIKNTKGIYFIRIGRASGEDFLKDYKKWEYGKISRIKDGRDLILMTTGSITGDALKIADEYGERVGVVDIHSIKPLDEDGLVCLAKLNKNWLVIEEGTIIGGLFGAIAETVLRNKLDVTVDNMGLLDCFGKGYGNYNEIKDNNGLGLVNIKERVESLLSWEV